MLYLNTDFSHVRNFFQNILLKTAWLYDVRLQNYGAINFVQFFWITLYVFLTKNIRIRLVYSVGLSNEVTQVSKENTSQSNQCAYTTCICGTKSTETKKHSKYTFVAKKSLYESPRPQDNKWLHV